MATEVSREAWEMSFDFSLMSCKGGAGPEVDGRGLESAIGEASPTGVDPVGREALVFGGEIRGGKAEAVTATFSRDDLSEDGKGATEHSGGFDQFAFADGGTDSAAADSFLLVENGHGIIESGPVFFAPSGEEGDISRAVASEAPVGSDGDGFEGGPGGGDFLEEVGRFLKGAITIKGEGDGESDSPTGEDAELMGESSN